MRIQYWDENLLDGRPPFNPIPQVVGITVHLTFAARAYDLAGWYRRRGAKDNRAPRPEGYVARVVRRHPAPRHQHGVHTLLGTISCIHATLGDMSMKGLISSA